MILKVTTLFAAILMAAIAAPSLATVPGGIDVTCDVPRSGSPNFRTASSQQTTVVFRLYDDPTAGNQIGPDYIVPMSNLAAAKRYTDHYDSVAPRKAMRINATIGSDGSAVVLPSGGQAWLGIVVGTNTFGCDFAATGSVAARRRLESSPFVRESNHSATCDSCVHADAVASEVSARVRLSGSVFIPDATDTTVSWDAEQWDTAGLHDPSVNPSRLTVPVGEDGTYLIFANIMWNNVNGGIRSVSVHTGGRFLGGQQVPGTSAQNGWVSVSTVYQLSSGDYVTCSVYQNSGAPLDIVGGIAGTPNYSEFGMIKLH